MLGRRLVNRLPPCFWHRAPRIFGKLSYRTVREARLPRQLSASRRRRARARTADSIRLRCGLQIQPREVGQAPATQVFHPAKPNDSHRPVRPGRLDAVRAASAPHPSRARRPGVVPRSLPGAYGRAARPRRPTGPGAKAARGLTRARVRTGSPGGRVRCGGTFARACLSARRIVAGYTPGGRFAAAGALVHTGGESAMSDPATTMHVGPLGSTIHVLRADADTVAELAAIDWNRHFRRVCLDPVRGLITLMAPLISTKTSPRSSITSWRWRRMLWPNIEGDSFHSPSPAGRAAGHRVGARLRVLRR